MPEDNKKPSGSSRSFRQESDRRYLLLAIFTLVVIGGGLIAIIFGPESLLTALPCLLGGAVLLLLPWAVLALIQRWRDRIEKRARFETEAFTTASGSNSYLDNSPNLEENNKQ